ncbi:52k protein [Deer mastadenovirus B]|uniref:Packaging protein 3 n=1 Tax=Deer mastadenovirus B TaxID=2170000 RepID=A0A1Y0B6F7_9ADEN|nr:52k protein [Deer mastadenovirus B]ART33365.1 52k protein [Deer mastadenovirus B]
MMHPALRQMKPRPAAAPAAAATAPVATGAPPAPPGAECGEGEGLARLHAHPDNHPRVCVKRDAAEAYIPRENLFRDRSGEEPEGSRDLKYKAGRQLRTGMPRKRVLTEGDFEVDERSGISSAKAHMEAADLVRAYEQTVKQEANFQKSFNNHVRTLISREETTLGLMHLWDFAEAYSQNPASKTLTAQLFLIVQHLQDEGIFREAFLSIAEPEGRWMLDLLNILQSIVVQERQLSLPEKVAAVNYSVVTLGKHYARKIFKSPFVPLDKEVKISTFYMRAVLKVLSLSYDLGMYRNEKVEKLASIGRRREMSDAELLFNLRRALTTGQSETFDEGGDFHWAAPARASASAATLPPPELESETDDDDEE